MSVIENPKKGTASFACDAKKCDNVLEIHFPADVNETFIASGWRRVSEGRKSVGRHYCLDCEDVTGWIPF